MSLAFHSTLTPAHQTHSDEDGCSADTTLFILRMSILGVYLGMGVFWAESSDLLHMGVYTCMGVVLVWVWALLWANTVF